MFDCGVNLCSKQFNNYLDTLKTHSIGTGLNGWIAISNSEKEWEKNIFYCRKYSEKNFIIKTTIGIHPHNAVNANFNTWKNLNKLVANNKVIAIGECGLDYNRMFSPAEIQMEVFIAQMEIANKYNLPLYLHERDAHDDFYNLLCIYKAKYPNLTGIVHCFTGTEEQMKKYIEFGFYIGITGWICDDRRNKNLCDAVISLPLDKLILETDSPFLIPFEYSKEWNTNTNQPDSIHYIIKKISQLTGIEQSKIKENSIKNTKTLFKI